MNTFITICIFSLVTLTSVFGEIMIVDSLNQLNEAISQSDKNIRMKPGNYDLKDLDQGRKRISFSGSNNTINLKGVKVKTTVGSVRNTYIVVKGNNNTIIGGDFEDVYRDGTKEVKEFGTYNLDRRTLSAGLSGDAVISIYGDNNTVQGIKLTVKGGKVINSTGDFSFGPLSDYRSNRSSTKTEWTITPSPYASGDHNLLDLLGNNHHVTLYRTNGPIDRKEKRAIVITGSGSTVINNTEYTVILEKNAKNNTIKSYGTVTDLGSNNTVKKIKSLNTKQR